MLLLAMWPRGQAAKVPEGPKKRKCEERSTVCVCGDVEGHGLGFARNNFDKSCPNSWWLCPKARPLLFETPEKRDSWLKFGHAPLPES